MKKVKIRKEVRDGTLEPADRENLLRYAGDVPKNEITESLAK